MALSLPLKGPEAARLAAEQAAFNEKKWVWVPDDKEGYLSGYVIREDGEYGEVMMASGSEVSSIVLATCRSSELSAFADASPAAICSVEDESPEVR